MTREEEIEKVKELIKENIEYGSCGLFNCGNWIGDSVETLFKGSFLILKQCYGYCYFEVFGTTENEFDELMKWYEDLVKQSRGY